MFLLVVHAFHFLGIAQLTAVNLDIMLIYLQIFPLAWYKIIKRFWMILVIYGIMELFAIYTYQFDYVEDFWIDRFNDTDGDFTYDEM